jgi:hypothetical protein
LLAVNIIFGKTNERLFELTITFVIVYRDLLHLKAVSGTSQGILSVHGLIIVEVKKIASESVILGL